MAHDPQNHEALALDGIEERLLGRLDTLDRKLDAVLAQLCRRPPVLPPYPPFPEEPSRA